MYVCVHTGTHTHTENTHTHIGLCCLLEMHKNVGTVVVFERDWETKEENETFVFLHLFNYFQAPTRCQDPEDSSGKETQNSLLLALPFSWERQ